jgi:hypothetical protein
LFVSGAAVVPTPVAVLITSAAETAGDSTTGASSALVPNASWPEAFFPLPDIIGGTLLTKGDLSKQPAQRGKTKLRREQDN